MKYDILGMMMLSMPKLNVVAMASHVPARFQLPVPTVRNPLTGRKINVGGPKYNQILKQGGWVQHKGTLVELNLDAALVDTYQSDPDPATVGSAMEHVSFEDWHCVAPAQGNEQNPLDGATESMLQSQLVFVNKPAGLHCVPPKDLTIDSLSALVASQYKNAKPCHRLDRDTSGVVVFGLTAEAHRDISKQFEARAISKRYVALVAGHPKESSGVISLPIGKKKSPEGFHRWAIGGDKPREAVTEWHLDQTFDLDGFRYSRVVLLPKTGRGHQLRLHMHAIGHSILGDTIHGERGVAMCSPRLCLHAQSLQVGWKGLLLEASTVAPF